MYLRVATALASCEKDKEYWTKQFYNLMAENKFMPNSPTLMNAGRRLGMLSACFVLPVEDDLDEIFSSVKATALVQRAGGGTGFNFSNLRPSGSIVKSSGGTTSGPLSFIDVFSKATDVIQQGAFRRGANMGIMNIDHPDIVGFIKAKSDLNRWQNYNVSIAMTDAWMDGLLKNPTAQHEVSHKEWGHGYLRRFLGTNEVRAFKFDASFDEKAWVPWTCQDTWDLICKRAWETGEPGLFFVDKANANNPVDNLGKITATNPCFHPDTLVETIEGQKKIKDITEPVKVYSMDTNGALCIRQASASWLSKRSQKTKRITMYNGDSIVVTYDHKLYVRNKGWTKAEDIHISDEIVALCRSRRGACYAGVKLSSEGNRAYRMEHRLIAESVYGPLTDDQDVHHIDGDTYNNHYSNLAVLEHAAHATLTANEQPNNHQVVNDIGRFITHKDSKHGDKTIVPLPASLATNHSCQPRVESVEEGPITDVYDISVEGTNNLLANRLVAHNCGEQPLHAYDSCNLGSVNLSKYVKVGTTYGFDYDALQKDIPVMVRFLDNVIEVNNYPIPEIEEMSKKTRRIGLGVMGWADSLFQLGIKYDSDEAIALAKMFSKWFGVCARVASSDLGKEKGNFGAWEGSVFGKEKRPMRNAYQTTVAPTGTISIIADCSGGIEPLFALAFKRTVMPDSSGKFKEMYEENKHWVAAMEKYSNPGAREYAKEHGNIQGFGDNLDWKPRKIFVTSHDISPEWHVKMQAAWQTGIDTAISKTINIRHDEDVRVVSKAYTQAYHEGCKGITVYRDGCRNNIAGMKQPMSVEKVKVEAPSSTPIVTTSSASNPVSPAYIPTSIEKQAKEQLDKTKVEADKRLSVATASLQNQGYLDVYPSFRTQIKTQFGNLHVHIVQGSDGKEREIFAQLGKAGDLIAADLEGICRMASVALRNNASIKEVADQLEGIGTTHIMPSGDGKIISMPDALAKAIRKYMKATQNVSVKNNDAPAPSGSAASRKQDAIQSQYGVRCPQCNVGRLEFSEGCQKCRSCGYSAC